MGMVLYMNKKARLKDIADKLGISVSSVHRAMMKPSLVSDDLKGRIHTVAEELGYEVNLVASSLSSKKILRFVLMCGNNLFFQQVITGARSAERELQIYGVTVDVIYGKNNNYIEQLKQLNELAEDTVYDGIVLAPTHSQLLNPVIAKITEKGIPVVSFVHDIPGSARRFYVGENPKITGETAAFLYDNALPEGSVVAVMGSYVDTHGLNERLRCFKEYLDLTGKLAVTNSFQYFDSVEGAYEMCTQVLANIKPAAIFSNTMLGTIGCARAIQDMKLKGEIFMVGFDVNDEIAGYLNDGTLFASLQHAPFMQGSMAVKALFGLAKGTFKELGDCHYINTNVVFKTNVEEFIIPVL